MKIVQSNERVIKLEGIEPFKLNTYYNINDKHLGVIPIEIISVNNKVSGDNIIFEATGKPLEEIGMGIHPNATIEKVDMETATKFLLPNVNLKTLMPIGVIRSTEHLQTSLPKEIKNVCKLFFKGKIEEQNGVPFFLDANTFREYPHIGLFGGSGSGKSYALRVLLEELMEKGFPAIVLDPHNEMEFCHNNNFFKGNYLGKYEVLNIGQNIGICFEELTTLQLSELIEFMGELTSPMKVALEQIHQMGDSITYLIQKIHMLQEAFANEEKPPKERQELHGEMRQLYYSLKSKIAGTSTLQALAWRIEGLSKQSIFTNNTDRLEQCLKTRKLVVIRGNKRDLNIVSSYVIRKMYQKRRNFVEYQSEKMPPFYVVTDEAHIFAPKDGDTPTTKLLVELAQESRKYGVFLSVATQRPNLLHQTITAQLNTKFIFRTVIASDIRLIKTETNLTEEESERLPYLKAGNAYVSSPTCKKSIIQFRASNTISPNLLNPLDELNNFTDTNPLEGYLLQKLPFKDLKIKTIVSDINKENDTKYEISEVIETLNIMEKTGLINAKRTPMGKEYH